MNPLTLHIAAAQKVYVKVAVDFTVNYVIEQIQLEQGSTKKKRGKNE